MPAKRRPADPELEEALKPLFRFLHLAQRDLTLAMDLWAPWVRRANSQTSIDVWEFSFFAKTLVRTLFGVIDALGYLMRQVVVGSAERGNLEISNPDLAEVSERIYNAETDHVTNQAARFLPTLDSFKLALIWFPRVFGEEYALNLTSPGWQSLAKLKKARDRFTHPSRLEHLVPRDAYLYLQSGVIWFLSTMVDVFQIAMRGFGQGTRAAGLLSPPVVKAKGLKDSARTILDAEFYKLVSESKRRTLAYVTEMMRRLGDDTARSFDLLQGAMSSSDPREYVDRPIESDDGLQFSSRNVLRTLFSEVEGTVHYIEFMLTASSERGEIHLGEGELEFLRRSPRLEDRVWLSAQLWAREFGYGGVIDQDAEEWRMFVKSIEWRNGVTHPQQIFDYVLLPSVMKRVLTLPSLYAQMVKGKLEIDTEKYETRVRD